MSPPSRPREAPAPSPRPVEPDWARSPARWSAVIALAGLCGLGITWSILRGRGPVTLTPAAITTAPNPIDARDPAPAAEREPPAAASPSPRPRPANGLAQPIDLNTATQAELELLPGIGPALAARIIASRQSDGLFEDVDDLDRVPGIGPKTMARLRPLIRVSPPAATASDPPADAAPPNAPGARP